MSFYVSNVFKTNHCSDVCFFKTNSVSLRLVLKNDQITIGPNEHLKHVDYI